MPLAAAPDKGDAPCADSGALWRVHRARARFGFFAEQTPGVLRSRKRKPMDHERAESGTAGMRAMFWAWMGIIVVGLAVMIVLPLAGR